MWRIEPIGFDPELVERARAACERATGTGVELASGALHDAAEIARRVPTVMIFTSSRGGISHAREEDTDEDDLRAAIEVYGLLAADCLTR